MSNGFLAPSQPYPRWAALVGCVLVAGVVVVAAKALPGWLSLVGAGPLFERQRWLPHFLLKTALFLFAIVAWKARGRSLETLGIRRPSVPWSRRNVFATGVAIGTVATALILISPAEGMSWIQRDLGGLPGIVLWIWFYSSVCEEVFVRGWLQSSLERSIQPAERQPRRRRLSTPATLSGVFFGAMHLAAVMNGADPWTLVILVPCTTLLGLVAASYRERFDSLLPAVLVHVAFNVGGTFAGVLYAVFHFALTGEAPDR